MATLRPGAGSPATLSDWPEGLPRLGHKVAVVTTGRAGSQSKINGVTVHRTPLTLERLPVLYANPARPFVPPWPDRALLSTLRRVCASERPDVIHAHGWCEMAARKISTETRIPLIVTLHDYGLICPQKNHLRADSVCDHISSPRCWSCPGSNQSNPKRIGLALALRYQRRHSAPNYIAVSTFVANHHRAHGYPVSPVAVIPNFIDDPTGPSPDYPANGDVLFVGPDDKYKGLHVLRAAQEHLRDIGSPVVIRHVGGKENLVEPRLRQYRPPQR